MVAGATENAQCNTTRASAGTSKKEVVAPQHARLRTVMEVVPALLPTGGCEVPAIAREGAEDPAWVICSWLTQSPSVFNGRKGEEGG